MAACFCCFGRWSSLLNGPGFNSGHVPLKELPTVQLDTEHMGQDAVIVKNGRRICGTGATLANAPIVQDKAYFEVKIQSTGIWGLGLGTRKVNVNEIPLGSNSESWVLRHNGSIAHNNEQKAKLPEHPSEGDIIGVAFNHIEMNFYMNGKPLNTPITGVKGTVYPIVYVDEGAILDVFFDNFYHSPPDGYTEILVEQSLL
ncbi:unnamed protein product [Owenia fusiformis]|uniref:Uncharacterized protein n=1 Tax=Owenia fusiformis TaxID=6347 RepID=A0A8J1UB29_OWEFU|nr:unnamed protein product [Owenia fusiformis]